MISSTIKKHIQYLIAMIALPIIFLYFRTNQLATNVDIHTNTEVIATMLALFVGSLALVRYYSKKDFIYLIIGCGFLGTSILDGFHTIVTSEYYINLLPSKPESLISLSWLSSRTFLAIALLTSLKYQENKKLQVKESHVYSTTFMFTLISLVIATSIPLPNPYSDSFFSRSIELIPGLIMLFATIGFYRLKKWQHNDFHHYLMLGLIISTVSQIIFMSTSIRVFDYQFQVAHVLKILSYIFILVGLLINTFQIFNEGEINKTNSEQKEKDLIQKGLKIENLQEDFLFLAAHELKGPVTTIQWNLDILKEQISSDNTDTDTTKTFKEIANANQNLITLVNNLLNVNQLEDENLTLDLTPTKVNELILKSITKNKHHQDFHKVTIINLLKPKTPLILADRNNLQGVFDNVLANSIKYNKTNGEILIRAEQKDNNLHIYFKDNGIGIHNSEINKIFKKFYRSPEAKTTSIKGTGLGLYISKKLIQKMNGKIWAESEGPDLGSTIHITLPISTNE